MHRAQRLLALVSILALLATLSLAQDPKTQTKKQTVAPATPSPPVAGGGTFGQIPKWTSSGTIGDSNVTEDKLGKVGIGTQTPTSPLTVRGVIESMLGGIKFPDGTTQTTAGVSNVFHDASLQGAGISASPLGVAVPLNLSGSSAPPVLNVVNGNGDGLRGASTDSAGVRGDSNTSVGVRGDSVSGIGVLGNGLGSDYGVVGESVLGTGINAQGGTSTGGFGGGGIFAKGGNGTVLAGGFGVFAKGGASSGADGGVGVFSFGGASSDGTGGIGLSVTGGEGGGAGRFGGVAIVAVRGGGMNGAISGSAARFLGDVDVQGKLTKTMGTFKIDHPLDPENKYLYHSFVESPDMMNIYNGNITTDPNGEAVVEMPDYFDALNKDFRYQLTVIGTFAQAIVATKMKSNRFVIRTSVPNVEVSWMVTGVRQDAYANKNRVQVEENKLESERGYYLHPEVFNQPAEKSIQWAQYPEMMQRLKQQRLEAEAKIKRQQQQ